MKRSAIALLTLALTLGACQSSDDDRDAPRDDGTSTPPTAPAGLVGVHYPGSGIELEWGAAQDDVAVLSYDVSRDGTRRIAMLDATSYLDTDIALGADYDYEVRAVDDEGTRGPPAVVRVSTPDASPVLTVSNWFLVLSEVFDVYTRKIHGDRLSAATGFDFSNGSGRTYEFWFTNTMVSTYREHDCANGGLATRSITPFGCGGRCYDHTSTFYACEVEGTSLLGRVRTSGSYNSYSETFDDLSIVTADGEALTLSGSMGTTQSGGKVSGIWIRHDRLTRYASSTTAGTLLLEDLDIRFGYGRDDSLETAYAILGGSFTLRSPTTGGAAVAVTTPVPFEDESSDSRRFPVGTLVIEAEDGSRIELEADNGDPDTVTLRVGVEGRVDEFVEAWDDWVERLESG